MHMVKYKYVPFSFGKQVTTVIIFLHIALLSHILFSLTSLAKIVQTFYQRYNGNKAAPTDDTNTGRP